MLTISSPARIPAASAALPETTCPTSAGVKG